MTERECRKSNWLIKGIPPWRLKAERRIAIICGTVYILRSNIKKSAEETERTERVQKGVADERFESNCSEQYM